MIAIVRDAVIKKLHKWGVRHDVFYFYIFYMGFRKAIQYID